MKSYTDLEQSKKLAKILSPKSADMFYIAGKGEPVFIGNKMVAYGEDDYDCLGGPDVLCWSLAALIDIIENIDKLQKVEVSFTHNGSKYWVDVHFDEFGSFCQDYELYDSKVDACAAMIEKLHKLNLL